MSFFINTIIKPSNHEGKTKTNDDAIYPNGVNINPVIYSMYR